MHEIEKLEKKWLKYKIKKNIFKSFFTVLFFAVLISIFTKNNILENKNSEIKKAPLKNIEKSYEKKTVLEENITKKSNSIKKSNETKNKKKEKKYLVLTPKIDLTTNTVSLNQKNEKKKKPSQKIEKTANNEVKRKILIKKREDADVLITLAKKFEKHPNPKLALFLSKTYYKDKNYKKALYWAIKANELDSSNSESWILFAKASVKLGKKEDAVKALKAYLKTQDSLKAKKLLNQIINGDFK